MTRPIYVTFLLTAVLTLTSGSSFAHPGRTDADGCHNDRKNGGYHCHGAPARSSPNTSSPSPPAARSVQSNAGNSSNCHPSYSGCLRRGAGDYDCAGGGGNGPNYTGKVHVTGPDEFDLDRDGDGWGCE